jgi:hypothetical protein
MGWVCALRKIGVVESANVDKWRGTMSHNYDHHWNKDKAMTVDPMEIESERKKRERAKREAKQAKKKAEREKRKAERPKLTTSQRIADMGRGLEGFKARIEVFEVAAAEFGRRCQPILAVSAWNVPGMTAAMRPDEWRLSQLQTLVAKLRTLHRHADADLVNAYAESQLQVIRIKEKADRLRGVQANLVERAKTETTPPEPAAIAPVTPQANPGRLTVRPANEPVPTPNRADAAPVRLSGNRARSSGWSTTRWVGSGVIPENPPAWHATTPPWLDGPTG